MTRRSILIHALGDQERGLGHVRRSLSVARVVQRDLHIIFSTNQPDLVQGVARNEGIDLSVRDVESTTLPSVDFVLHDDLKLNPAFFEQVRALSPRRVTCLDFFHDTAGIDRVINLLPGRAAAAQSAAISEGFPYAIISERFHSARVSERVASREIQSILVMFGGSDPLNLSQQVLHMLSHSDLAKAEIRVVQGPLNIHELLIPSGLNNVERLRNPSELPRLMAEADLAFAGTGTTLFELLYLGVPVIAYSQNEEENLFLDYVLDEGLALDGRNEGEGIPYDQSQRQKLMAQGQVVFDGLGIARVIAESTGLSYPSSN